MTLYGGRRRVTLRSRCLGRTMTSGSSSLMKALHVFEKTSAGDFRRLPQLYRAAEMAERGSNGRGGARSENVACGLSLAFAGLFRRQHPVNAKRKPHIALRAPRTDSRCLRTQPRCDLGAEE